MQALPQERVCIHLMHLQIHIPKIDEWLDRALVVKLFYCVDGCLVLHSRAGKSERCLLDRVLAMFTEVCGGLFFTFETKESDRLR